MNSVPWLNTGQNQLPSSLSFSTERKENKSGASISMFPHSFQHISQLRRFWSSWVFADTALLQASTPIPPPLADGFHPEDFTKKEDTGEVCSDVFSNKNLQALPRTQAAACSQSRSVDRLSPIYRSVDSKLNTVLCLQWSCMNRHRSQPLYAVWCFSIAILGSTGTKHTSSISNSYSIYTSQFHHSSSFLKVSHSFNTLNPINYLIRDP